MLNIFSTETADEIQHSFQLGSSEFAFSGKVADIAKTVESAGSSFWLSKADWSMHELLAAILNVTGPAEIHISSYAFSETPARVISSMVTDGIITALHCFIDSRVDIRSASAHNLIVSCCATYKLGDTHAKVTTIRNEKYSVCIVGSANYTGNKRYEAGIITTDIESYNFHTKWIADAINSR